MNHFSPVPVTRRAGFGSFQTVSVFEWTLCLSVASDSDDSPEQRNLLLHEAVRALFACSPLFHTQTLTLEAFPVPAVCCSAEPDEDESMADAQETLSLLCPSRTNCRKRPRETQPLRERKRTKSNSWCENKFLLCFHGSASGFNLHFNMKLILMSHPHEDERSSCFKMFVKTLLLSFI